MEKIKLSWEMVVVLVALIPITTVGCGANAVQQHTTAISAIAAVTAAASETTQAAVTADAERSCPDTIHDDVDVACIAGLRQRWAPVDTAFSSVRLALVSWLEAVALAASREDLWPVVMLAARSLGSAWNDLAASLAAHGVSVPALPQPVLTILGGGQ